MKRFKIAISGSYGGLNIGDEAILEVMLRELRSVVDADVVVFSRNPEDTERRHNVRAVPIREMDKEAVMRELKDLDLFVLGGGGILFDGMADKFLRDVRWAQDMGIPVFVYAISVGPLKTPESKKLVAETLNTVDKITVREGEAKKILNELGVDKDIEVTCDPALLLKPAPFSTEMLEKQGMIFDSPIVGFSVREPGNAAPDLNVDQYHEVLANAADFMIERFKARILFIPMERHEHKDLQHSHAIISKMANAQRAYVLKGEFCSAEILGLISHLSFVVGMRLHILIFSAIQGVPFVPLPYASKIKGFLADLEMPMPPINAINSGKLCAFLDRLWDARDNLKKRLEEKVPLMQQRSLRNNELLCAFLNQRRSAATVSEKSMLGIG